MIKKFDVYNIKGKKIGQIDAPEIFNARIIPHLVHKILLWHELNRKKSTAHTKTRGERRGGGAKPWRQKGTGRARFGSIRTPIWRKGGITFGPTPERNFKIKVQKKEKRAALKSVLADKAENNNVFILDKLKLTEIKTKKIEEILVNLNISESAILAISKNDEQILKSAKNLSYLKATPVEGLNVYDLLKYTILLTTKDGLEKINEVFGK